MKYRLPTDEIHRFFFNVASLFPSALSNSDLSFKIGLTRNLTVFLSHIETNTGSLEFNRYLNDSKYTWENDTNKQVFYVGFKPADIHKIFLSLFLCSRKKLDSVVVDLQTSELILDNKYVISGTPVDSSEIKLRLWKSSPKFLTKDSVKAFKQSFQFDFNLIEYLDSNAPIYLFTIDNRIQPITFLSFLLPAKFNVPKRYYLCKKILLPNFIVSEDSHLGPVSVFGCAFDKAAYQCIEHSISEVTKDSKVCFSFDEDAYILGIGSDEYIFKGSFGQDLSCITKLANTIFTFQSQESKFPVLRESVRSFTKEISCSCILQDGLLLLEEDLLQETNN